MLSQVVPNVPTRQNRAEIINADWRKSIESIVQVGRDLIEAKGELPHGEFTAMCQADLHFSANTARTLMGIARDPNILSRSSSGVADLFKRKEAAE